MQTDRGTKPAVDQRLTSGLSADETCSSFLAADQCAVALFPGHALHENGLQRQIGDGTLVSSQEERALFVPLINRG